MSWLKTGALIVFLALANNLLLLHYIDSREQPETSQSTPQPNSQYANRAFTGDRDSIDASEPRRSDTTTPLPADSSLKHSELNRDDIVATIKDFMRTDDFVDLMVEVGSSQSERHLSRYSDIRQMDTGELLDILTGDASVVEKQIARARLVTERLDSLDTDQLELFYEHSEADDWSRSQVLTSLIEKGSHRGLELAKEALLNNSLSAQYIGYELLPAIYDTDPEFMREYLDNLDYSDSSNLFAAFSVVKQAPELQDDFYQKNWRSILNSQNRTVLLQGLGLTRIEFNYEDQQEVIGALFSDSKSRRQFAMGLINNIDDISALRDAYYNLGTSSDRDFFRTMLRRDASNSEANALADELAQNQ